MPRHPHDPGPARPERRPRRRAAVHPLWGLAMAAGLGAMFWAYWRFTGRHWSVYLLATPILLAVAFL